MAPSFSITTVAIGVVVVLCIYRVLQIGRRPANYPPGPPTIPILGNIHLMPTKDAHLQYQKWAQEYGPIYSLILGTQTLIVLSDGEVVKELLDKKSVNYSDRMDMYIGQTVCSGGMRLLMMRYGAQWRSFRKMVHGILNVSSAKTYVPYQMLENKQMLHEILHTPDDVLEHIRRYSNSLTTTMTFGWRTPSKDDPQLQQLFEGFNEFAIINQTGTAAVLDSFPFLRWLPDAVLPVQSTARRLHKAENMLYKSHYTRAKSALRAGTAYPSFSADMVRSQDKDGFSDEQAGYITGTLLEAGSDTTSSTLYGFVQAMLLFPDVQKRAQAEIDAVIGPDRLPTMDDEFELPYIRGIVKESLRWMPTTILGAVPHAAVADDTYNGYLIPAGAGIMNNVYTINMDPKRWTNPRTFDPARYINDNQSLYAAACNADYTQRDQYTFGAGRRICPGIHIAERSLFLGISRILWAFTIAPRLDAEKRPILPDPEKLTQGFVCMPEPFDVNILPRSRERAERVERDWSEARSLLDPVTMQWREVPEGMKISIDKDD